MKKSSGVTYLLWLLSFIGLCGLNRFYLGKVGTGILWLLTFGLFGFGILYDLFTIPRQVDYANGKHWRYSGMINNQVFVNVSREDIKNRDISEGEEEREMSNV